MNRSQFQITHRAGKIIMADMNGNEKQLTAVQAERLAAMLSGAAKQLKRARRLSRLRLSPKHGR